MKSHSTSLALLFLTFLTIIPMFLGHLLLLTSYKIIAVIVLLVFTLFMQLPLIIWNSLPESSILSILLKLFGATLKHFPSSC